MSGDDNEGNKKSVKLNVKSEGDAETTVMAVAVAGIGSMDSFRPEEESWAAYIERFQCFVDCNQVEQGRKVAMLLTVIGSKTYGLLRDLCTPRKPAELGFDEIVKTINDHLFPKPSFRAERFKFYRRLQASDESIAQYIAILKKMATSCDFGTTLNDRLHDMLIGGVTSKSIRERLIGDDTLTYEAAVKIANSMEAAQKEASKITQENQQQAQVNSVSKKNQKKPSYQKGKGKKEEASGNQPKMCWRCGYTNHKADDCRFKSVRCNGCQEEGHLRKMCPKKVHQVEQDQATEEEGADDYDSEDSTLGLYFNEVKDSKVNSIKKGENKFRENLKVEGKTIRFDIDTGSAVTIMSEKTFKQKFPNLTSESNDTTLSTYTG